MKTQRPTFLFMMAHPAHLMALGWGSGLFRWAPGTAGTLWAWGLYVLALEPLWAQELKLLVAMLITGAFFIGWWACTLTASRLQDQDPSAVVWDEIVAFWMLLALTNAHAWQDQLILFFLFRFFDIVKWGPVAWADTYFKGSGAKGGWGIMFDDLVAALMALMVWQAMLLITRS